MQVGKLIFFTAFVGFFAGCSGRGAYNSSAPSSTSSSSSNTDSSTFNFVAPATNSQHSYAKTIVDNSNSTINQTVVDTVTTVNPDGSFVISREDPSHSSLTVNGTNYSVPTSSAVFNNSDQEVSYTYTNAKGILVTCTDNPHAAGPNYPVSVGDSWSSSWNYSCANAAPINFTQTGSVVDTEMISIPAGTFSTFKLQSTIVWTDANGTTHTDTRTTWRDVNGSHVMLKEVDSYVLSGVMPVTGYPVSVSIIMQD